MYELATAKNADGSKKYPLDIALHTLVTKVNFDTISEDKPRATGIDYLYGESLYRADPRASATGDTGVPGSVTATREVIVAGGTFNTPQILKLSGIGPADELVALDIPVVKDLPGVGTNLQDRYEVGVSVAAPTNFTLFGPCTFITTPGDPCYTTWARPNPDPLSHGPYATNGIALGLMARSSTAGPDHDLWIGGVPGLFQGYFPGMSRTVVTPSAKNYFTWLVLKAHSRNDVGTVTLRSADPRDTPRIAFHSFGEGDPDPDPARQADAEKDLRAAVEGMRWGIKVFEDALPLGEPGTSAEFERVWPPAEVRSDEELEQWVRDEAWGHHASCTCPIGADDDPMAVLDGQFRVRGVEGLRVVDASAFPKIP